MPRPTIDHPQVTILVPIRCDLLVAPLIEQCWRLNMPTRFSCQGSGEHRPNMAQIMFHFKECAPDFVWLVHMQYPDLQVHETTDPAFQHFDQNRSEVRFSPKAIEKCTHALSLRTIQDRPSVQRWMDIAGFDSL